MYTYIISLEHKVSSYVTVTEMFNMQNDNSLSSYIRGHTLFGLCNFTWHVNYSLDQLVVHNTYDN